MNSIKKILSKLDRPIFWFIMVMGIGGLILEESYNEISSLTLFIFAIVVWEYERRKRGK